MLGSFKDRHVRTNLGEDSGCCEGIVDSRNGEQKFHLWKIVLYNFKNEGLQLSLLLFQKCHVAADDLKATLHNTQK